MPLSELRGGVFWYLGVTIEIHFFHFHQFRVLGVGDRIGGAGSPSSSSSVLRGGSLPLLLHRSYRGLRCTRENARKQEREERRGAREFRQSQGQGDRWKFNA